MEIFLFCLISIPLYSIFINISGISRRGRYKILFLIAICQLFLISALRADSVGGDLSNYIPGYKFASENQLKDLFGMWEPGFMIFIKMMSYISSSTQWFIVSTSFLINFLFARYIYRNSQCVWMTILIFIVFGFYSNTMNIIRHSIALMIILNSIEDIINNNFKRFVVKTLIAASFQITALIFLPAYLCSRLKFSYLKYMYAIIGVFIISKLGIVMLIILFLLSIFMPDIVDMVDSTSTSGGGYMLGLTMIIIVSILWLIYKSTKNCIDESNKRKINVYFNLQLYAIIIQLLFAPVVSVSTRLTAFYLCPLIVLAPTVIQYIYNKNYKIITFCGVLSIIAIMYIATGGYVDGTNSDRTLPYYFFWQVTPEI